MADPKSPHTKNVNAASSKEGTVGTDHVRTGSNATRSGLPANCIVMPMRILDPPEPIKKNKKR